VFGLAGGLLHVWNHALFKSLLFLAAGSVIHATHTRDIDRLGGLAKAMPITAFCFLVGAVAICGLPPLNGFVSEWLIYLGFFHAALDEANATSTVVALAAPALALVGALAMACFVKVFGAVFLGSGRTQHVDHARESGAAIVAPMLVLTACCATIGMAPQWCAPALDHAIAAWAPGSFAAVAPSVSSLAPLSMVSAAVLSLAAALAVVWYALHGRLRRTAVSRAATWGCGYARPTARMQYTSSSFAQMLVRLFDVVLRPAEAAPRVAGPFPTATRFHSDVGDTTLDRVVRPLFRAGGWLCGQLRFLQRGRIQANLLYIVLALVALLLCR
jgi:hydrogenase-4 component B